MTKYFYFLFAFAIIGLTACQSEQSEADSVEENVDLATQIKSLEDSVFTENREGFRPMQDENARLLTAKYQAFAKTDVEETKAIDALFKAVSLAQNVNRSYAKAAQLLNQIYTDYPESNGAIRAKFDEAYLYANVINDHDKAKELYEIFIKNHPDSEYTTIAKQDLSILGKSLDDILKEAKEKTGKTVE